MIDKGRLNISYAKDKCMNGIKMLRQLQHQFICKFEGIQDDKESIYIFLENCPNKSLQTMLENRKYLTELEV